MKPSPSNAEPSAVAPMLRQAIDLDRLRRVLRLAGADAVVGEAELAVRETVADTLARRMRLAADGPLPRRAASPTMDANLLEESRAATKRAYVEVSLLLAGGSSNVEAMQQALAVEIAALAQQAVRYARQEGRAVDHHCVAVAAARVAEEIQVPGFVAGV